MTNATDGDDAGARELRRVVARRKRDLVVAALASGVVNVLALTGSIYMLQVYDRVVTSRSVETLAALTALMVAGYAAQGWFDSLRARMLARIAAVAEAEMRGRVARACMALPLIAPSADPGQPARDADTVRAFCQGSAPSALFDLPWLPVYMVLVFALHPLLGAYAIAAAVLMSALTLATEHLSKPPALNASKASATRARIVESMRRNAESIRAMGLTTRVADLYASASHRASATAGEATDVAGRLGQASRTARTIIQSGMLGAGAWLVIHGQASPGVMIAASIAMGRALAPIETAIANWKGFLAARAAWRRLAAALSRTPDLETTIAHETPSRTIEAQGLSVAPPGEARASVVNVTFRLAAGTSLAVMGASAAGKSSLARALVGAWPAARGAVRLDGVAIAHYPEDVLARSIGYMGQNVELFDATIAENICRLDPNVEARDVFAAAKAADVHQMILDMPQGYATRIGEGGTALSGGQRQRIGLARALYADPFLVVLDEPNSHLDQEGDAALTRAIAGVRQRGGIVVVIAHRPNVLSQATHVMVMQSGQIAAFGSRDEVMAAMMRAPVPVAPAAQDAGAGGGAGGGARPQAATA